MDFTRDPIIQSVITPKEGCKLVIRSSKAAGQEEFFVDAVEVVSFGNTFFFRSLERPKSFLVPSNDYEVLEVREARLVLKNVGMDRSIKIGGGRKEEKPQPAETLEPKTDKKREKRRQTRRRRSKGEAVIEEIASREEEEAAPKEKPKVQEPKKNEGISSLLPPPSTLISETIARYKDNALFKDAFFSKEQEEREDVPQEEFPDVELSQPEYGSFELTEEEEEEIYQQRQRRKEAVPLEEELPTPESFEEDLPTAEMDEDVIPPEDLINTPDILEEEPGTQTD